MKKTFAALALALAVAMPLAGCSGNDTAGGEDKTGSMATFPPGGGITSGVENRDAGRATDYGYGYARSSTRNPGTDDLAGSDGLVGGSGGNNTGSGTSRGTTTYHSNGAGTGTQDPVARMGRGIENTLDDMGNAARDMGQDARQMLR